MKKYIIILTLTLTVFTACEDFLDVKPTGSLIPSTVEDYDKLLNQKPICHTNWINMAYMDPDLYMPGDHYANIWEPHWENQYQWTDEYYDAKAHDWDWNDRFKWIHIYNQVINNVDDASLGFKTENDRDLVKGEARAQRAMDYFLLVNEYAHHYSASTVNTPAIPISLEVDLQAQLPLSTVGEVYDQILEDLLAAEELLQNGPAVRTQANFRPGIASIKALLGEIYLYMGDFEKAKSYTNEALALYDYVYDFNELDHINPSDPWEGLDNDREFYFITTTKSSVWGRRHRLWFYDPANLYHPDLAALYNQITDRRFYLFFHDHTWYDQDHSTLPNYVFMKDYHSTNAGMSVPRLMLTNAEAKARTGDGQGAIDMLNQLAYYRYTTRSTTFTYTTDAAALQEVKDERRRELCFCGINLIDLKRYHAYGETIPTFTRTHEYFGTVTLEPGSDKYVVPIPRIVRDANPNIDY
jgi:hypothetical protein